MQHCNESKVPSLLGSDHWPPAPFAQKRLAAGRGQVDTAPHPAQAKGHTARHKLKARQGPAGRRPPPSRCFSARPIWELQLFLFFFNLFQNVFIFFHYQKTDYTNKYCVFVYPGTLQFSKKIILSGISFFVFLAPRSWSPVFPSRPWLVRVLRKGAGTPAPQSPGFLQAWGSGWHLWKAGPHHCPGAPGVHPLPDPSSASSCLPETTSQARTQQPCPPLADSGGVGSKDQGPSEPPPPGPESGGRHLSLDPLAT